MKSYNGLTIFHSRINITTINIYLSKIKSLTNKSHIINTCKKNTGIYKYISQLLKKQ